jgi:hypothetical protein
VLYQKWRIFYPRLSFPGAKLSVLDLHTCAPCR